MNFAAKILHMGVHLGLVLLLTVSVGSTLGAISACLHPNDPAGVCRPTETRCREDRAESQICGSDGRWRRLSTCPDGTVCNALPTPSTSASTSASSAKPVTPLHLCEKK